MRGDVTRQTFRSGKHYRSVLQQQGRVLLDAEWNEQADIQAYLDRTVTADLVGGAGAPRGNAGMAIVAADGTALQQPVPAAELWISDGHYYVDGILCENDAPLALADQPDLPGVELPGQDGTYIAYLDVWFEHITRLEDPLLQEVALGGPDTTTRARTIWQVRLRPDGEPLPPDAEQRKAQLRARAVAPTSDPPTPCVVGPAAGYRRLENQLYRVEVFDPTPPELLAKAPNQASEKAPPAESPDGPTFLWSRENGSVVAALTEFTDSVLTIAAPGRDTRLGFEKDDWVEVTDLARMRRGEQGFLAQLGVVDGSVLPVVAWYRDRRPVRGQDLRQEDHPVARRWDGKVGPQPLFPDPSEPDGIRIEDGIHVEFAADGVYRTGDYWLIPARTTNLEGRPGDPDLAGTIEWPRDGSGHALPQPPAGVVHHYVDIARLTRDGDLWGVVDLRPIFDPLTDLFVVDVTMAGGDGQESLPGVALDEALQVAVTRNLRPVKGATVRFTTADDDALLVPPDPTTGGAGVQHQADVETDDAGIASCGWQLAPTGRPSQEVSAQLLDSAGVPTGPVLRFAASLSLADRVAFVPGACVAMDGATTVQSALERLAAVPVLVEVEGNGQVDTADATLTTPVAVLVRGCGAPVPTATVRFAITEGGVAPVGGTPSAPSVDVPTDDTGVAHCLWQLGRDVPLQTLTATLLDGTDPDPRTVPLTFVAGVVPSALTVERVELPQGTALVDGASVAVTDLAGGPTVVVLDRAPEPVVADGPALTVTLDLPFPFSQSDRDLWPPAVSGTLPLQLDGAIEVTATGGVPAIGWSPSSGATAFLDVLFTKMGEVARGNRVRGHVRLAGSVLGPTAADVTRWFWLEQRLTQLVVVPHRDGRLRLPSAQRAIALSLSRDPLRASLPAGVTVADVAPDPDGAKAAARHIFTAATPARPLILVVDARYTAAGVAVRDALATVNIELQPLDAADPVADVTTRLGNGEADRRGPHRRRGRRRHRGGRRLHRRGTAVSTTLAVAAAPVPATPVPRQVQRCGGTSCPPGTCGHDDEVQRLADGPGPAAVPPTVLGVLGTSGAPLDTATRTSMEDRFGHDFGQVRIHTDADAARSAADIHALAYTYGSHVVMGAGRYQPHTSAGRRLLAHELTHVTQQGSPAGPPTSISDPHDPSEQAAERAADLGTARPPTGVADNGLWSHGAAAVARRTTETGPVVGAAVGAGRRVPGNTVTCVRKYTDCRAPYSPGSWAARVTYHCPVFPGLPGNTAPAYVTIPDEFIGTDEQGRDQYRCRPRSSVVTRLEIGDAVATGVTRNMLFPDFASCHAGFRNNLALALSVLFQPSGGGGHTWGGRVNQAPPRDFPC